MPAQYVKPYVQTNKSDFLDAEAIAEAVQRPRLRFVPIKTEEQLDLQALHRVRERWVMRRTAVHSFSHAAPFFALLKSTPASWRCLQRTALDGRCVVAEVCEHRDLLEIEVPGVGFRLRHRQSVSLSAIRFLHPENRPNAFSIRNFAW